jgi:hypothetical protein
LGERRCIITCGPIKKNIDDTTDDVRAQVYEDGADAQFGNFGEFPSA